MVSMSSYTNLWAEVTKTEVDHAKSTGYIDRKRPDELHDYYTSIDDYATKRATSGLTNLLPLLQDFKLGKVEVKSLKKSNAFKDKGNNCFKTGFYADALAFYRRALMFASSSGDVALLYGNLSAAFIHLERYSDCMCAIKAALDNGFPKDKQKLIQRMNLCCEKMSLPPPNSEDAFEALTIQELETSFDNSMNLEGGFSDAEPKYGADSSIHNFSAGLKMERSEAKGRYIVSEKDFEHGDILLVEEPFAWILLRPHRQDYCYGCMSQLNVPIPCTCSDVLFCSKDCRERTMSFHKFECPFMFFLNCIGVGHLCLKIIIIAGLDRLLLEDQVNPPDKYSDVYHLVTHYGDQSSSDVFEYGLTAWLITNLLRAAGFFPEGDLDVASRIGSICFRHILQLQCNAHAITSIGRGIVDDEDDDHVGDTDFIDQTRVATAIYPSVSLLNHACSSSVLNSFEKTKLVLRAVKSIHKGDEVFNCYGPQATRSPWSNRMEELRSQYFFSCSCSFCSTRDKGMYALAFACEKCSAPLQVDEENLVCTECNHVIAKKSFERLDKETNDLFEESILQQAEERYATLVKVLEVRKRMLYKYNTRLGFTYDNLGNCLCAMRRFDEAAAMLEQSLEIVRHVAGSRSVEYAWELTKLASVYCFINELRSKEITSEVRSIFELNHGKHLAAEIMSLIDFGV